jgi:hypothetical protein
VAYSMGHKFISSAYHSLSSHVSCDSTRYLDIAYPHTLHQKSPMKTKSLYGSIYFLSGSSPVSMIVLYFDILEHKFLSRFMVITLGLCYEFSCNLPVLILVHYLALQ